MKKLLLIQFAILFSLSAWADYSTLTPGAWSDVVSVWSVDGTTPCGCSPGSSFSQNVSLHHTIDLDMNLVVQSGATLNIDNSASLSGSGWSVSVGGSVLNHGSISLKSINMVSRWTYFTNHGSVIVSNGNFLNSGFLTNDGSIVVIGGDSRNTYDGIWQEGGSILVSGGSFRNFGMMNLGKDLYLRVIAGDFSNDYNLAIGVGTCILVESGNFDNNNPGFITGSVTGKGSVFVGGVLNNQGSWANTVNWCSPNPPIGTLPVENCPAVCGGIYPLLIHAFEGEMSGGFAYLNWIIAADAPFNSFSIERMYDPEGICSVDNCIPEGEFQQVGTVAANPGAGEQEYFYTDKNPLEGMNFYRLKAIPPEGEPEYSRVLVLQGDPAKPSLVIYPNPTRSRVVIRMTGKSGTPVKLGVYDIAGRQVWIQDFDLGHSPMELEYQFCNLSSGVYLIKYQYEEFSFSRKLVVVH